MQTFTVDIHLTTEQLERFYAGHVSRVWARDRNGVSLAFPLSTLRPFVTHTGVSGTFKISVDSQHKLKSINEVSATRR